MTTVAAAATTTTTTTDDQLVVALGQNKGSFICPYITLTARPFDRTDQCIDLVSFDVGTTHLGIARVRYDRAARRCCIVQGAQIDIYHPHRSLELDTVFRGVSKRKRQRKPAHVEPFDAHQWPPSPSTTIAIGAATAGVAASSANDDDDDGPEEVQEETVVQAFHRRMLREKQTLREQANTLSQQWMHDVELMPFALHLVPWLHDTSIDRVLVEQQDQINTQMRCIGYCIFDIFQTRRMLALEHPMVPIASISEHAALELFPSTLKLSQWVINVLLQSWRVYTDASLAYDAPACHDDDDDDDDDDDKEANERRGEAGVRERSVEVVERERKRRKKAAAVKTHDDLVNHASHGKKKASAVRVLTHLFTPDRRAQHQHPFYHWLSVQRSEKHNVCDAILQAFAWIIKYEQEPQMERIRKRRKQK